MARKAILDAYGGVVTWVEQPEDGVLVIRQREDEAPLLRENAFLRSEPNRGSFRRIASVPVTLIQKWLEEDGIKPAAFWKWKGRYRNQYLKNKVNSPDYKFLRTSDKTMDRVGYG